MDMKAPASKVKARQKFIWFSDAFDTPLPEEIFVDGFAGGGGAGTGVARALGHGAHIAINHDRDAISMYVENHPESRPYCENIFRVEPKKVCEGRRVKGAWFSPDCTSHSKAKGGKPKEKKIRGLSWVVLHWMAQVRPAVIFMENVEEITKWGPLDKKNIPIKEREGEHFNAFVGAMQDGCEPAQDILEEMTEHLGEDTAACLAGLGYKVEWRELVASDYGAPTTRKRLFLVARCDGKSIVWPEPTHGSPKVISQQLKKHGVCKLKKWKPVADVIDWNIPCPSIFATSQEIKEQYGIPRSIRPLAEKTQKRIAEGISRYVIGTNDPFIVKVNHSSDEFRGQSIKEPLTTITGKHGYGVVAPFVSRMYGQGVGTDCLTPLGTATSENKSALVAPYIMALQQGGMTRSPLRPLHTICASRKDCNLLVAPALMSYYGPRPGDNGHRGRSLDQPMATQTTENRHSLVAAFISKHFGGMVGVPATQPFPTITGRGTQNQLTVATMIKNNHGGKQAFDIREPLRTIMAQGTHHAVTTCRVQEVRAFLFTYYGNSGYRSPDQPVATITAKDRLALGIVMVGGQPYQIIDIGMRMLTPRELFDAQGFPSDYKIEVGYDGRRISKTAQVARCGNSVSPHPAEALVKANLSV